MKIISTPKANRTTARKFSDKCMICSGDLDYFEEERECKCDYCGQIHMTHSCCVQGHFVCEFCYREFILREIESLCSDSSETDLLVLLERLRRHPVIPVNGSEHHSLVPAIIIAAYRNSGGQVEPDLIAQAVRRGASVMAGSCSYVGVCGSASGVGIAFSLLLQADPKEAEGRNLVQQVMCQVLEEIVRHKAPRCCQRESWLSLRKAAELSLRYLPIPLRADAVLGCQQIHLNKECIGRRCPLLQEKMNARKVAV